MSETDMSLAEAIEESRGIPHDPGDPRWNQAIDMLRDHASACVCLHESTMYPGQCGDVSPGIAGGLLVCTSWVGHPLPHCDDNGTKWEPVRRSTETQRAAEESQW